ncbi:unnamed protein product [Arctia plantaginis]|uniref:Uncharacterized protein n=1 Tax=Arctia plantaginis TaxID=874455 RepID=A0A8S0ZG13_ARCPL|nr:unnamed protein product [Arctia plantaginis]
MTLVMADGDDQIIRDDGWWLPPTLHNDFLNQLCPVKDSHATSLINVHDNLIATECWHILIMVAIKHD